MLNLSYFLSSQSAEDLFDAVAGLNNPGVMRSFHTGLRHSRTHLMDALHQAQPGGDHETMCYHFQVGTSLLMSLLDGMAVFVEKKIAVPPTPGAVYWSAQATFLDPRFTELRTVQQQSNDRIIKGGITANTLRNLAKHYVPWVPLAALGSGSTWDIRFPIDAVTKSGPVLHDLLFPLYNDACAAHDALGRLLGVVAATTVPL